MNSASTFDRWSSFMTMIAAMVWAGLSILIWRGIGDKNFSFTKNVKISSCKSIMTTTTLAFFVCSRYQMILHAVMFLFHRPLLWAMTAAAVWTMFKFWKTSRASRLFRLGKNFAVRSRLYQVVIYALPLLALQPQAWWFNFSQFISSCAIIAAVVVIFAWKSSRDTPSRNQSHRMTTSGSMENTRSETTKKCVSGKRLDVKDQVPTSSNKQKRRRVVFAKEPDGGILEHRYYYDPWNGCPCTTADNPKPNNGLIASPPNTNNNNYMARFKKLENRQKTPPPRRATRQLLHGKLITSLPTTVAAYGTNSFGQDIAGCRPTDSRWLSDRLYHPIVAPSLQTPLLTSDQLHVPHINATSFAASNVPFQPSLQPAIRSTTQFPQVPSVNPFPAIPLPEQHVIRPSSFITQMGTTEDWISQLRKRRFETVGAASSDTQTKHHIKRPNSMDHGPSDLSRIPLRSAISIGNRSNLRGYKNDKPSGVPVDPTKIHSNHTHDSLAPNEVHPAVAQHEENDHTWLRTTTSGIQDSATTTTVVSPLVVPPVTPSHALQGTPYFWKSATWSIDNSTTASSTSPSLTLSTK